MDDLRWFAPNRYCLLPVEALRARGLRIATEGTAPARAVVAADGVCAEEAFASASRLRCPLLLYLWDLPPWRVEGRPDFVFALGGRARSLPRPWGRYRGRPGYYSRLGYITRKASLVLCPSSATRQDVALRFGGVDAEPVPYCYDSDRFAELHAAPPAGPLSLLSVSRLVPHKNHAVVIRAAARLGAGTSVRIIGEGPERAGLADLAAALHVPLQLADGWTPDAELLAAYRAAHVVVAPSRFEGFGLSPMEGLGMGAPVVASDIGPHRELLDGMVRFFPPDDPAALAAAIQAAATEPLRTAPPPGLAAYAIAACADRLAARIDRLLRSVA